MNYLKDDGSILTMTAIDSNITIGYTSPTGLKFNYVSDGESFSIKGLAINETGDTLEATDESSLFATFVKGNPINVVTFVHCGLMINVRSIE